MNAKRFPPFALTIALSLGLLACATPDGGRPDGPVDADSPVDTLADVVEVRGQLVARGLIAAAPARFAPAEAGLAAAAKSAQAGRLAQADAEAARAARRYRAAFLDLVEDDLLPAARTRLAESADELAPEVAAEASRALSLTARRVEDARGEVYDVGTLSDLAFNSLVADQTLPDDRELAPIEPCPDPVQPDIADLRLSAPAPGQLSSRGDVRYLVGRALDVSLRIPGCTRLTDVALASPRFAGGRLTLGTDGGGYDPIEGQVGVAYYYEQRSNESDGAGGRIVGLRLHFPGHRDGRSYRVELTARSVAGNLAASQEFTLAQVEGVNRNAVLSISEADLRNGFIAGIYDDYGDDGVRPKDPAAGVDRTLKNPSYKDLVLEIREDGIHFAWQVEAVVENFCDASVGMNGIFHLERNGANVNVVWDNGPNVGIDFLPCVIPTPIGIAVMTAVQIYFENRTEDTVRQEIQQRVAARFGGPAVLLIVTLPLRDRELLVDLDLGPSVTVKVPYATRRLEEAQELGLAVPADEANAIVARGLPQLCFSGELTPQDCVREVATGGLFNWNTNVPVPSPWFVSELGTVGYQKERHKAWKELMGLRRESAKLPFPGDNVGALVVRAETAPTGGGTTVFAGEPCDVTLAEEGTGGEMRLGFGANDHRFIGVQELGSGMREITVAWPPIAPDECRQATPPTQLLIETAEELAPL